MFNHRVLVSPEAALHTPSKTDLPPGNFWHYQGPFWLALGLAILLRIVAVCLAPSWASTDSHIYHAMGKAILNGEPVARLPNGLPLLEAGLQALLGDRAIIGLLSINILASAIACALVFALARHYRGLAAAWIALTLMILYPHTLNYVRFELTETISMTLLLATVWGIVRKQYLAAGLCMGLLWLFRSSMLPVGVLLCLLLVALPYAKERGWAALKFACGFGFIWLLHALLVECRVVQAPANLTENLLWAISATSTEGIPFELGIDPAGAVAPLKTYWQFAWEHPGDWFMQRYASLWELLGPWPSVGGGPHARGTGTRLMIGLRFGLLLMALGAAWRMRHRGTLLLFAPIIGIAGLHFFFFSEPRFWVPCEPFLMILAAGFWADCRSEVRRLRLSLMPKWISTASLRAFWVKPAPFADLE